MNSLLCLYVYKLETVYLPNQGPKTCNSEGLLWRGLEMLAWGKTILLNRRDKCYYLEVWSIWPWLIPTAISHHALSFCSVCHSSFHFYVTPCMVQHIRTFPFDSLSLEDFIAPFAVNSDIYSGDGVYGVSRLCFNTSINNLVTPCQVNSAAR